jgi:hypothetical protein
MILTKVGGRLMPRILTKVGGRLMNNGRVLSCGAAVGFLLVVVSLAFPPPARAAWVNSTGTQFQVGGQLGQIIPNSTGTSFINPACNTTGSAKGGTSLALVPSLLQGLKLSGVDPVLNPLVLAVSCLDTNTTTGARLNFINPANGKVVTQISTNPAPSTGYPHFVFRPDKGDLLGCGENGSLYSIAFLKATGTPPTAPTTQLSIPPFPPDATPSCTGLTWDAEADMIYMGLSVGGGNKIGRVIRFKQGTTTLLGDFTSLPCTANGLAISGGVLLMSCVSQNNPLPTDATMLRLDKSTGLTLGVFGKGTTADPSFHPPAGLGDLACDPVTFHKDPTTGRDLFTDALWSRLGDTGNTVVALEFPAFTCGLPSNSVVLRNGVPFSPLAAGLSDPGPNGPGQLPLQLQGLECFDAHGDVKDSDGDGLPDCWETSDIDFDGDGNVDLDLCVQVDTNGDGIPEAMAECADANHKDLFVEIDYMQFHKPDPKALSQTQRPDTVVNGKFVGVQSVREAFAAAPVCTIETPGCVPTGIRIHFQVDEQLSHFDEVVFTPCTASAGSTGKTVVDFDTVKAANFGTATDRANAQALNAKRLAFRYVLFAHNLAPLPGGGVAGSGCAEVGGDDAVVSLGTGFLGSVAGHTGSVGSTDEQAGTLMHEFGHLVGLRHGGDDTINCKPNYRSVMSYNRQLSGNPIVGRRLDYSRSLDPVLNELSLNEFAGLGVDPSLGALPPYFNGLDQIAFGPGAWSFASVGPASPTTPAPINWNRSRKSKNDPTPTFETSPVSGNLNDGSGCTSLVSNEILFGHDDWSNILYRASAAIDFAGGGRTESPLELTAQGAEALYLGTDADSNGAGDGTDCGGTINPNGTTSFPCKHRIDVKPSFPFPKTIDPGAEATITIAIFSEPNPTTGKPPWSAPDQVNFGQFPRFPLSQFPLTFRVESFVVPVKVNNSGGGTCSVQDVQDPISLKKDGIKDIKCQFPVGPLPDGTPLPEGTHFGVVSGYFFDPPTDEIRAFTARQEVNILE